MKTPIADHVRELRAESEQRGEGENPFTREQAALAAAGPPRGLMPVGSTIADHRLIDARGIETTLRAAIAGRRAVIVLYRGAWCPYCNLTLRTYQQVLLPALVERGAVLVAVSPQKPDGSLSIQEKNELAFPVLSDPGNSLARALGVLTRPSQEVLEAQRLYGLDLIEANADGTIELPMPTVAIVDETSTLRWIDVHPDYTTRSEPDAILAALDGE